MLITDKSELTQFEACHRVCQGIPGIARTKGRRTFVSFYSGNTGENYENFVAVIMSEAEEKFGEPIVAVKKPGRFRCYDPCLWIDPLSRLWLIWSVMPGEEVYGAICDDPDAKELVWSEEFYIGRGVMMNKPLVLSTGEWLFPIAIWKFEFMSEMRKGGILPDDVPASYVYKTSDNGKTFTKLGGADIRYRDFDEHMLIEMNNGVLRMLVRMWDGIGESYSYDRGRNWSSGQMTDLKGPCSRFFIGRLRSGRILLVNHYDYNGRNNLTAMLSDDDGITFPHRILLDGRDNVSYPDAMEGEDGYIYISYDRERGGFKSSLKEAYACAREILVAKITEEDILNGKITSEGSYLQKIATKLTELSENDNDPYQDPPIEDDELAYRLISSGEANPIAKIFEKYPIDCINATNFDASKLDSMITKFNKSGGDVSLLSAIITFIRLAQGKETEPSPIIETVKEYIEAHLSEDVTVSELAESINISVYYLSHLFKKTTGTSIIEYRNELRLTRAKLMLIDTTMSITDIAQALGFCSSAYFSEVFSKSEKIPPNEFRKYHKRSKD